MSADEVQLLWDRLAELENEDPYAHYPDMKRFPERRLTGQGFFPGGDGLWRVRPESRIRPRIPLGGVMFLGNDFGTYKTFEKTLLRGYESVQTWEILKKRIEWAKLFNPSVRGDLGFYTNAVMGLRNEGRAKDHTERKTAKWWRSGGEFATFCRKFLAIQISTMKPRLIVLLGPAPRFALSLPEPFIEAAKIWGIDLHCRIPSDRRVQQGTWEGQQLTFLLTTHPSSEQYWHQNDSARDNERELDARLLAEAWTLAKIGAKSSK